MIADRLAAIIRLQLPLLVLAGTAVAKALSLSALVSFNRKNRWTGTANDHHRLEL